MALGRRDGSRQGELWVATGELPRAPRHVFYEKLNGVLKSAGFDAFVEDLCEEYYATNGRPSIPPGVFFRMVLIGYFEDIRSQRGIAWRCEDSRSLQEFLGFALNEETPDHSSLSRIKGRLPLEVFQQVFTWVLALVREHKLLGGKVVGVDSTTLEADAAMKSIVRKDTGEDWEEYIRRLAKEDGVEIQTKADLIRYDQQRNKKGEKKTSNEDWESPSDPDARIAKMKDGTTHLAYKAEHVIDLDTEVIIAAEIYHANEGDASTIVRSVEAAQQNLVEVDVVQDIEKVVADKGYHKAQNLVEIEGLSPFGIKTYIPEPQSKYERVWTDKPASQKRAVYHNRDRCSRDHGKALQRRRSEVVERSFAHLCETGGSRRSWLTGIDNVRKRYSLAAAAHNLGLILRQLIGSSKPRGFAALGWLLCAAQMATRAILNLWSPLMRSSSPHLENPIPQFALR